MLLSKHLCCLSLCLGSVLSVLTSVRSLCWMCLLSLDWCECECVDIQRSCALAAAEEQNDARAEVTHPPWSLQSPGNQLPSETVRPRADCVRSTGPFCNQPWPQAVTTDHIAQVRPAHCAWLPGNPALSRAAPEVLSLGLGQIPGEVSRVW